MRKRACLAVSLCAALSVPGVAHGARVTEFSAGVPATTEMGSIVPGPDGNLWFTESTPSSIGRINPTGGLREFSAGISSGSSPDGIAAGPDGNLWFTEFFGDRIARITPTGAVTQFSTGITPGAQPRQIVAGPDGSLWFTEFSGNRIARVSNLDQNPPTIDEFSPGPLAQSPSGITAGPDGNVWFTEILGSKVVRVSNLGGNPPTIEEFSTGLPPGARPNGITTGPDGNLWFADGKDRIGRVTNLGATPPTIREFTAGITAGGSPLGIASGPDGNLWFTESGKDRIGRITPAGAVKEFSAGITHGSSPALIAAGPDGNLWSTSTFKGKVGRIATDVPAPSSGNLLRNPGFEAGSHANSSAATAPLLGWAAMPYFTGVAYGTAGGFPSGQPGGGGTFAAGGPTLGGATFGVSRAIQHVDVAGTAEYIDRNLARANLGGLLGGFMTDPDNAAVTARFLAASGATLGSVTIGPVTKDDRGGQTKLLPRLGTRAVPAGTRAIRVVAVAIWASGGYNDAYFDNLALTLTLNPLPKPVIADLTVSRASFPAAGSGLATAKPSKKKPKTGADVTYTDTLAGTTAFKILRQTSGRTVGGVCVPRTTQNRNNKKCKLNVAMGTFTHADIPGKNRLHMTGRLGGHKLKPGKYRLSAVPRNHDGRIGNAVGTAFKIVP